jgi:hypothetical protein
MTVDNPTVMQILVAWRNNRWVVARNAQEVGAYAYKTHALDRARALTAEAVQLGIRCYMLVRDQTGAWQEKACPKPAAHEADG